MGSCNDNRTSFWALDKWDKIGISIILITFAIFSISSCFATSLSGWVENNLSFQNGVLVSSSNYKGWYIKLEEYSNYTFTAVENFFPSNPGFDVVINLVKCSSEPSEGVSAELITSVSLKYDETINFNLTTQKGDYWLLVTFDGAYFNLATIDSFTLVKNQSMSSAIQVLANNLTPSDLWDKFKIAVPYISVVVLVSFGFFLIFHIVRNISKGRGV